MVKLSSSYVSITNAYDIVAPALQHHLLMIQPLLTMIMPYLSIYPKNSCHDGRRTNLKAVHLKLTESN